MVQVKFAAVKQEAEQAVNRGGDTKWPRQCLRLLDRIYDLERELQDARQLKLFGDVPPPPPKTPVGV